MRIRGAGSRRWSGGGGKDKCWYWLGAISSTGHGKFRAGSRAAPRQGAPPPVASRIISAHVYAYQPGHGVIPARRANEATIRHWCDEPSCQNWTAHLLLGTYVDNIADYQLRRGRESGPLADVRGARGCAVAIRNAILAARTSGADIEQAIRRAIDAGARPRQDPLF
jgi:hypothetical protein